MAAWPGGPCPHCGVDVPAMMIRCTDCRAVLNPDLEISDPKAPAYVSLPEVTPERSREAAPVTPRGFYVDCGSCGRTQKLNARYAGKIVRCKHCESMVATPKIGTEDDRVLAYYLDCPLCGARLTLPPDRLGRAVACRECDGVMKVIPTESLQAASA